MVLPEPLSVPEPDPPLVPLLVSLSLFLSISDLIVSYKASNLSFRLAFSLSSLSSDTAFLAA